eukprot:4934188-Pleurochrysis_carterae.AAC.2
MSETAGTLVRAKPAAQAGQCASVAIVGRALVFRVQRAASQFGFAFSDGKFALVLGGKLVRSKRNHPSGRIVEATHAKGCSHFHRTRLRVGGQQDVPDRRV